jgi:hypothetical protein
MRLPRWGSVRVSQNRLIQQNQAVPGRKQLTLLIKLDVKAEWSQGLADIDAIGVHAGTGQVGEAAGLRISAFVTEAQRIRAKADWASWDSMASFSRAKATFWPVFGSGERLPILGKSFPQFLLREGQMGRAGPELPPAIAAEAAFEQGSGIKDNLLGIDQLSLGGAKFKGLVD